jgi:hypothetical protein
MYAVYWLFGQMKMAGKKNVLHPDVTMCRGTVHPG